VSLSRHEEAIKAFRKGIECDPSNDDLKQRLAEAEREAKYTVKRHDDEGVSDTAHRCSPYRNSI